MFEIDDLKFFAALCGIIALLVAVIILPLAWFEGHAKSAYIKQTQGIELPWYQSAWLQVSVNNVNAKVKSE